MISQEEVDALKNKVKELELKVINLQLENANDSKTDIALVGEMGEFLASIKKAAKIFQLFHYPAPLSARAFHLPKPAFNFDDPLCYGKDITEEEGFTANLYECFPEKVYHLFSQPLFIEKVRSPCY